VVLQAIVEDRNHGVERVSDFQSRNVWGYNRSWRAGQVPVGLQTSRSGGHANFCGRWEVKANCVVLNLGKKGTCSCPGGCVGDVPNDCTTVKGSDIIQQTEEELGSEEEEEEEGKPQGWFSGWF
jgi:hypothetical protein